MPALRGLFCYIDRLERPCTDACTDVENGIPAYGRVVVALAPITRRTAPAVHRRRPLRATPRASPTRTARAAPAPPGRAGESGSLRPRPVVCTFWRCAPALRSGSFLFNNLAKQFQVEPSRAITTAVAAPARSGRARRPASARAPAPARPTGTTP